MAWLIRVSDMRHSYLWHVTSGCTQMSWTSYCNAFRLCMWHLPFMHVTWLIDVCNMTVVPICDMTNPYLWHDSFMSVTCVIHACDMFHRDVHRCLGPAVGTRPGRPLLLCVWTSHVAHTNEHINESCHTWMIDINESCHTCISQM